MARLFCRSQLDRHQRKNSDHYLTYHVTGFRDGANVLIRKDIPDRRWFGADATLVQELKGSSAQAAIAKIAEAAKSYPYQETYRLWPGPNSNTLAGKLYPLVLKGHLDTVCLHNSLTGNNHRLTQSI